MKIINNIERTFSRARYSFERFPFSMAFILISAILFSIGIYNGQDIFGDGLDSLHAIKYIKLGHIFLLATLISIFLSLLFQALTISAKDSEELKKFRLFKIFIGIVSIIILYGVYDLFLYTGGKLFSYDRGYSYFGTLFFFIVSSCYIAKVFYHNDYVAYFIKILFQAVTSMSYSVVLFLGTTAIYSSLKHLFGVEIKDIVYANTAIFIFLPFNLGIFLSGFPKSRDSFDNYKIAKVSRVLLTNILIPIFTIYGLILYVYFAKIIFTKEMPKGIITNLVLWFSLLSVALIFILKVVENFEISDIFKKYFPIAMLPLLAVMFYSIGLRISQYGITESRYFVVVFGIFATASMLYFIFYEKHTNISVPIFLSLVILVSTNGPISAYNMSSRSQNRRIENILDSNNMLSNSGIIYNAEISDEDKNEISYIVSYMNSSHKIEELNVIPKGFKYTDENFKKLFGFNANITDNPGDNNYFYDYKNSIEIGGYNNLMQFDFTSENSEVKTIGNYKLSNDGEKITIYYKQKNKDKILTTISSKEIFSKYKSLKNSGNQIDIEDLAIVGSKDNINYKILFTDISCYSLKSDGPYYLRFYLLVNNLNNEE